MFSNLLKGKGMDDFNVWKAKAKSLLEGLEIQNIDDFMDKAKIGDFRNLGIAYYKSAKEKIEQLKQTKNES